VEAGFVSKAEDYLYSSAPTPKHCEGEARELLWRIRCIGNRSILNESIANAA